MHAWDVKPGWVALFGKTGQWWVPVATEVTDLVQEQIPGDVVWMNRWGKPLSARGVDHMVSSAQRWAGIKSPRLGVHLMRRSFATNHLRNGGGVFQLQRILGHQTLSMTLEYVKLAGVNVKLDQSRTSLARTLGLL